MMVPADSYATTTTQGNCEIINGMVMVTGMVMGTARGDGNGDGHGEG